MAITKDSGVRNTGAISLAELSDEDHQLIAARRQAIDKGLSGVDVPVNVPDPHSQEPHVAPLWVMYGTFAALLVLTAATVGARMVDLGALNIVIALGLAFLKSLLVGLFFMHLFWDSKFNQLVLAVTLLFLTIFIGGTIIDSDQYQPALDPPGAYAGTVQSEATGGAGGSSLD